VAWALCQDHERVAVIFKGIVPIGLKRDLPFSEGSWIGFNKAEVPAGGVAELTLAAMEMSGNELDSDGNRVVEEWRRVWYSLLCFVWEKHNWWSCG
jgi:hypothetical protein